MKDTPANSQPPAAGEAAHTPDLYIVNAPCKTDDFWEQEINSRSDSGVIVLIAIGETKQAAVAEAQNAVRACNAYDSDQRKIKALVEAMEAALPTLEENADNEAAFWGKQDKHGIATDANRVFDKARAALALAKEGQK